MKRGRGNSLRQENRPPPSGGLAGRRPFLSGEAPNPRMTPRAPAINGESAKAAGAPGRSVNHDPDAQPQVVLTRAGDEERLPHRLERRRRQDDAGLLVAAVDDAPVDLPGAHVDAFVELDVDAAAEGHREARLVDVEVADPEYVRQLRAVHIQLLDGDAEQGVREGLEPRPVRLVVLDLDAAEVVLHRRIDRAAARRP